MPRAPRRRAFFGGLRDGLPFLLVIVPFGVLFGVVAREAGWDLSAILGMSVLVIAGASQFTALQLLEEGAPVAMAVLTATAVNLRHAMYSASLAPHLGHAPLWQRALAAYGVVDQTYAVAIARYERQPSMSGSEKVAYFFGVAGITYVVWYASSLVGALLGARIPQELALDFAVPIAFLALFAPALRTAPNVAAAFVAVVVSLALADLPFGFGVLAAAAIAMCAGAFVEVWTERRA